MAHRSTDDEIREILDKHDWRDRDPDFWDAMERKAVDPELERECVHRAINAERREAYYSNYEFL